MKTSTSLGVDILHEREIPDDRAMVDIVYDVYIHTKGMYAGHMYDMDCFSIFITWWKNTYRIFF